MMVTMKGPLKIALLERMHTFYLRIMTFYLIIMTICLIILNYNVVFFYQ